MAAERFELTIRVTYEVEDEIELRAAAVATDGDRNHNNGDAAMHLLIHTGREKLGLPGATITGWGVTRTPGA